MRRKLQSCSREIDCCWRRKSSTSFMRVTWKRITVFRFSI